MSDQLIILIPPTNNLQKRVKNEQQFEEETLKMFTLVGLLMQGTALALVLMYHNDISTYTSTFPFING